MVSRQTLAAKGSALLATFFVGASAISSCLIVEVTGAEGDLSGTYTYDGSDSYIRRGGSTSYILGKYTSDEWRLGEGLYLFNALDNYPHYYTFDSAGHPADIVEAWQLVATDENEEEAPSSFSITCPVDPTPSPIVDPTPSPTIDPTPSPTVNPTPSLPPSSTLPSPIPGNANTPAPGDDGTSFTQPPSLPGVQSATSNPAGPTTPSVSGETTCTTDVSCPDDKCCHPETNTCGRTIAFCQERSGKKMCCQNALQEASTTESCFEDEVCEAEEKPWWDTAWWALLSVILIPICLAKCMC